MGNGETTQMNSAERSYGLEFEASIHLLQKEFDDVWKWIVEKHRRNRDEQHEKLREERRRKQEFDRYHKHFPC